MSDITHLVCPHCQAINRIPSPRLGSNPQCGKCQQKLFNFKPVELNVGNFQKMISRNDIPVLVDFWAPWCGPCKTMAPAFEQAAEQLEPNVRLAKLNTEVEQAIGVQYAIRSIPTLALFLHGKELARQPGALTTSDIISWVKNHL